MHVEEILLSAKQFDAGLTSLTEVAVWKRPKSSGSPQASEEDVQCTRLLCSIIRRRLLFISVAVGIPKTTIQNILQKWLWLHADKIHIFHEIGDKVYVNWICKFNSKSNWWQQFKASDEHRWGNLPCDSLPKQAQLLCLGTGMVTQNLWACLRLPES